MSFKSQKTLELIEKEMKGIEVRIEKATGEKIKICSVVAPAEDIDSGAEYCPILISCTDLYVVQAVELFKAAAHYLNNSLQQNENEVKH